MRKFFAGLLCFTMFWLLTLTSTIIITRDIFSENTVENLMEFIVEYNETENGEGLFVPNLTAPLAEIYPDIPNYFEEEDFQKAVTEIIVTTIHNFANKETDKLVDTTPLKQVYIDSIKDYEEQTGKDVPDIVLDQMFIEIDRAYTIDETIISDYLFIFEMIYSNNILLYLISGMALCIIVIFFLLGGLKDTLAKVKAPFISNGIGILLICYIIYSLLSEMNINDRVVPSNFTMVFTYPFLKVGVVSIVIGITFWILSKVLKYNKSIENSNKALENLGSTNYNHNNNIQNMPYTGDTFH